MSEEKKPVIRLSEQLADGQHWTIGPDTRDGFLRVIGEWWDEFHEQVGESFSVEVIEMTDAEIEGLPSI